MSALTLCAVTDAAGQVTRPDLLAAALPVHRQLRPGLPATEAAYVEKMQRIFGYGARMVVACLPDGKVAGLALYRVYENTYEDLRLYIDDLVTDEAQRSMGVGSQLLEQCETLARVNGCRYLVLDSGTWRTQAHKLYFRQGFTISSFHFTKPLLDA